MYISLNGNLLESSNAAIPALGEGLWYGYGLFETVKVYRQRMCFFPEHLERLQAGCAALNLPPTVPPPLLEKYAQAVLEKNNIVDGAVRITYLKNNTACDLLVTTRGNPYGQEDYERGFRLCFSGLKRNPHSPLVFIKSNNYLENILERNKAGQRGCQEAVFLNIYDAVCEGTISNLFFVKDKTVYTPAVDCGLLPGIARKKVMELLERLSIKLQVGAYQKEHLLGAEEIFLTNSLLDIMPVARLEDKQFDLAANSLTRKLMEQYKVSYYL